MGGGSKGPPFKTIEEYEASKPFLAQVVAAQFMPQIAFLRRINAEHAETIEDLTRRLKQAEQVRDTYKEVSVLVTEAFGQYVTLQTEPFWRKLKRWIRNRPAPKFP